MDTSTEGNNVEMETSSPQKKMEKRENLDQIKSEGRRRLRKRAGDLAAMGDGASYDAGLRTQRKHPDKIGLVYDEKMLEHRCLWDPNNYEVPERLKSSYERCEHYGLVDRCTRVQARLASEEEILSTHSEDLLNTVKSSTNKNIEELKKLSTKYEDVYFHEKTYECAMMAAGSTIELVEQVVKDKIRHGMALVRPPGHHAMFDEACGFCYFNNVAIAARHAVDNLDVQRVMIIDWDVHHGQGTQYLFYDDPRVLYISLHRYEYGVFWPNLRESDFDHIGEKQGKGFNINVPLNKTGMTNSDYLAIFHQILMPVAYEFSPELVLVSAGYDNAVGCPEGQMSVTPACFAHFIHMLKPLAMGRLAVIVEGGYCVESLSEGVALTLRALLGDPCPSIGSIEQACDSTKEVLLNCAHILRPYWKCLQFHAKITDAQLAEARKELNTEQPEDVVFTTAENRPDCYELEEYINPLSEQEKLDFHNQIQRLILTTNLSRPPHRTCLVYDERMKLHKCLTSQSHPERPSRISSIYSAHEEWGHVERCKVIQSRSAREEELTYVHDEYYIQSIRRMKDTQSNDLCEMQRNYNSIYLNPDVWDCACLSAGSVLAVVDEVLTAQAQSGVAIVRPPGHHAEVETACGFCFFNNVAVAAKYAQAKYDIKRVLILDWDVHHGNGTQHMFEDDPSVLYISLHRYDRGWFFPIGDDGNYDKVGTGKGEGYNINIAWNLASMGDSEYIAAFQQIVMPVSYEFDPELVIVSAGFDAAKGDPLGGYEVTPEAYGHMTHMLTSLANGKVILALEGGYNLHSISESMATCTSVLLGDICPSLAPVFPRRSAVKDICNVLDVHRKYWKCLQTRVDVPMQAAGAEDAHSLSFEVSESSTSTESADATEIENLSKGISDILVSVSEKESEPEAASSTPANQEEFDSEAGAVGGAVSEAKAVGGAMGGYEEKVSDVVRNFLGSAVDGQDDSDLTLFAVNPLPWCPHLQQVKPLPAEGISVSIPCTECGHVGENWVCLTCYEVHCSRYVNQHMVVHNADTSHQMALSYADLSVWCYNCDSYIHNEIVYGVKRAAHFSKFGEDVPGMT